MSIDQRLTTTVHVSNEDPILICYVEDTTEHAEKTKALLEETVLNPVETFSSGEELMSYLDNYPTVPGLILVDLVLTRPGMNGYETITALRDRFKDDPVKIVGITATQITGEEDTILQFAKRSGASAVIQKPFSPKSLYGILGRPGWFRAMIFPEHVVS